MNRTPFISIVLVCYNYAHLLGRALGGIACQTYRDFELVFVDNGCTDNSIEILNRFLEKYPDITTRIVTIERNIGLANGDNEGAWAAKGKYLMFHDADDWMDSDTLQLLAQAATDSNADRVIGAYRSVDSTGKIVHCQNIAEEPLQWRYTMQQANLFKNSIYKENNIRIKDSLWIDAEKTLRFSRYATNTVYVRKPCYNYYVHLDSTSKNKKIYEKMWSKEYSLEVLLKNITDEYVDADDECKMKLEYGCVYIYYSYLLQFLRDAPLSVKIRDSKKLRVVMKSFFPNYLDNIYLKKMSRKKDSSRSIIIGSGMRLVEKTGMMWLAMILYHIVSKVRYLHAS